jgi:hypothetical protein
MPPMLDVAELARALRAGSLLRDKLVVFEVDPGAANDPAKIEALATDIALARGLGIRLVAVCEPGTGPGPLDAQGPALRLVEALEGRGEHGVPLLAAGVVKVHRIPKEAVAYVPDLPPVVPVVNPALLIHLTALSYIPILVTPIADSEGHTVTDLAASIIAGYIAQFMGASLLLLVSGPLPPPPTEGPAAALAAGMPPLPPVVVTGPAAPGKLLSDILMNAPEAPTPTTDMDAMKMAFASSAGAL